MKVLRPFLNKNITFLEIGPGDCALSFELTRFVKQVYAVDVSDEITKASKIPENFQLNLSDGCSIPVPSNSVHVAYSNSLMEHLHPDDALEQLQHIYNALAPGGVYICITPNRLNGPADISKYFDVIATGFHLKEYTSFELSNLFKQVGFSRVRAYLGARGKYASLPVFPIALCEKLLDKLPHTLQKAIARTLLFRLLLGIRLIGVK
jgi:SAM-dependent methyltransferase